MLFWIFLLIQSDIISEILFLRIFWLMNNLKNIYILEAEYIH